MIVSNLRKSAFVSATTGFFPISVNGSTTYDGNERAGNNNTWIYEVQNNQGYGCNFFIDIYGYSYSGYRSNYSYLTYNYKNRNSSNAGYFVAIGTGNAAETTNDYSLTWDTVLEHRYGHVKRDVTTNKLVQVESVYENLSGSDVVIREIGLIAKTQFEAIGQYNSQSDAWYGCNYLVARKVLASPITVHNNEVYKFIYILDI